MTSALLAQTPPNWKFVAILWGAPAAIIVLALFERKRNRARQLAQMNAIRPDVMTFTNDGLKCDGPNGATALVPWSGLKGWREGQRVLIVERTEGNRFVMLPVAQMSENDRQPIRQFLQSHIPPINQ